MKASIAKAIVWNSSNYTGPSGDGATSGYPAKYGFGHEEWNNDPSMVWRGYRVFHTELTERLKRYATTGELGILMFASHSKQQFAVGIAAGVYYNDDEDKEVIAEELGMYDRWQQLWKVDLVRKRFENNQTEFLEFWRSQYQWMHWKVQPSLYHWFKKPILLDSRQMTGKQRLASEFGRFQPLAPETIIRVIRGQAPKNILDWFSETDFDERFLAGKPPRTQDRSGTSLETARGNAPTTKAVRYWVFGMYEYEPKHNTLQAQFVKFLGKNQEIVENADYVDLRYVVNGELRFVEVKPTESVPTKYAIRIAVGQLLEHRYKLNANAKLEIVLSTQPRLDEIEFVKSLGIGLWYRSENRFIQAA